MCEQRLGTSAGFESGTLSTSLVGSREVWGSGGARVSESRKRGRESPHSPFAFAGTAGTSLVFRERTNASIALCVVEVEKLVVGW